MPEIEDHARLDAVEAALRENAKTLAWIAARAGRIAAVQTEQGLRLDDTGERLDKIEARLSRVEEKVDTLTVNLGRLTAEFGYFKGDFAKTVAETMREVLREREA